MQKLFFNFFSIRQYIKHAAGAAATAERKEANAKAPAAALAYNFSYYFLCEKFFEKSPVGGTGAGRGRGRWLKQQTAKLRKRKRKAYNADKRQQIRCWLRAIAPPPHCPLPLPHCPFYLSGSIDEPAKEQNQAKERRGGHLQLVDWSRCRRRTRSRNPTRPDKSENIRLRRGRIHNNDMEGNHFHLPANASLLFARPELSLSQPHLWNVD